MASQTCRARRDESPWRRLPWTGALALLVWSSGLSALTFLMSKAPASRERPPAISARFIELPEPPKPVEPAPPDQPVVAKPAMQKVQPRAAKVAAKELVETQAATSSQQADTPSPDTIQSVAVPTKNALQVADHTKPNPWSHAARYPGTAVRAKSVGVLSRRRPSLSIANEETELMSDGMTMATGGWQQEYSEPCDQIETWALCENKTFSQPPEPWCFDTMQVSSQEYLGTCAFDFEQAMASYKKGDYATAFVRFKRLAINQYAPAQSNLGVMYAAGEGIAEDKQQAAYWWRQAATDGDAKAVYNLALLYSDGTGVKKDDKEAAHWYTKAAYYGYDFAQYNLAIMYAQGTGVKKDDKQAAYWYRKAADRGNAAAQYNLAVMYAEGTSIAKDQKKAAYWFRKAADRGDVNAQISLAKMYAAGEGVPKDGEQAYYWWLLASAQGNQHAEIHRDIAAQALPPQQRSNALAASKAWREK